MTRGLSASGLERGIECPTSLALSPVYETTGASIGGTENHAELETEVREYRKTGDATKLRPGLSEILAGHEVLAIERAFIVNVRDNTVRDLGESIGRNYGAFDPTCEVPTTLDLVFRRRDTGRVVILDWKSRKRVTRAASNWQVKVQVLAVTSWMDLPEVDAGICYLDNWEQDVAEFDAFDCGAIASDIHAALGKALAAKDTDPVHLGPWCDYCPAQTSCPGRAAIVRAAIADTDIDVGELNEISDERAGQIYVRLSALLSAGERAMDVLKDRAKRQGLPLPNGKHLRLIECTRKSVDGKKAQQLLLEAGIPVPINVTNYTQLREVKHG